MPNVHECCCKQLAFEEDVTEWQPKTLRIMHPSSAHAQLSIWEAEKAPNKTSFLKETVVVLHYRQVHPPIWCGISDVGTCC